MNYNPVSTLAFAFTLPRVFTISTKARTCRRLFLYDIGKGKQRKRNIYIYIRMRVCVYNDRFIHAVSLHRGCRGATDRIEALQGEGDNKTGVPDSYLQSSDQSRQQQ